MADAKLRRLSRADPLGAEWLRELQRSGQLTEEKLRLLAFCGHPGAKFLAQEYEAWEDTHVLVLWTNRGQLRNHMEVWAKALMTLGPSRTTPEECKGPGGALGTAIRESTGSHPKICVCKGTGEAVCESCAGTGDMPGVVCEDCDGTGLGMREIGGIWLGVLALVAAAKVALPLLRKQRRGWSDDHSKIMALSIRRAERWLKDPRAGKEPKDNPCGGDWGDVTEAWGGLAPLIWERHGQEIHSLARSMREFVQEFGEEEIRGAVEKRVIEWVLDG